MSDEAPVPLAEQIEFIRIGICALDEAGHDVEMMRAVLATLQQHELLRELYSATTQAWLEAGERITALRQQHERAMAVVEAARGYIDSRNSLGRRDTVKLIELNRALAALDAAASAAGDAGL